jgi:hypothetical protein
VLGFSHLECAAAADALTRAEDKEHQLWQAVLSDVKPRIEYFRKQLRMLPTSEQDSSPLVQDIRHFQQVARSIYRRYISEDLIAYVEQAVIGNLKEAASLRIAAQHHFKLQYADATVQSRKYATRIARDDAFREALAWQNPKALHDAIDRLLADDLSQGRKLRSAETLVASYVQRYCTKNDTIGFFGPVGWASFANNGESLAFQHGFELLAERHVYFEDWAIRALAAKLSADRRFHPWLTPKRMAHLNWDGQNLRFPGGSTVRLSDAEAAVVSACDGSATCCEIAIALTANPFLSFEGNADVYVVIERLAGERRIDLGFEIRVGDACPERYLRQQFDRINDMELKVHALGALNSLELARQELAHAHGNANAVSLAISNINAVFENVTHTPATRRAGETYGARSIVYEDCVRDMQLELAPSLWKQLQLSLDLVLTAARWYCHEMAQLFGHELRQVFDRLTLTQRASLNELSTDFPTFWLLAQSLFFGDTPLDTKELDREFIARWEQILPPMDGPNHVQLYSVELSATVQKVFKAPNCGWAAACHQCPDVMLSARDLAAIASGNYHFVLGEVHMGFNTLITQAFVHQHPTPERLVSFLHADLGVPRFIPLLSREGTQQPIRVQVVTQAGLDIEVCFSHDARPLDSASAISIGDLIVHRKDSVLFVRTRDGHRLGNLLDFFGHFLSGFAINRFRMLRPRKHTPRITIDKLVIQRESWRIFCGDLQFIKERTDEEAFLQARRWVHNDRIPRCVFVKVPWERKPFYVDFESPIYVRMLVKQVRNALENGATPNTEIVLTEMLPSHDDIWLSDRKGQRFTSEFRIVALNNKDQSWARGHS